MNYSASETYHDKCRHFEKKRIHPSNIRPRWYRNFYVLYQSKGYFTHNTFPFKFGEFDIAFYDGTYYGPFWTLAEAAEFANTLKETHENFILGG